MPEGGGEGGRREAWRDEKDAFTGHPRMVHRLTGVHPLMDIVGILDCCL